MPEYSIGVDLGGTNLRAAAVSRDGKMLAKVVHPTPLDSSEHIVDDIAKSILEVRSQMGVEGLVGTGVSVPGFIDMSEGVVIGWSKLPDMNRFPMRAEVERRIGSKVILENDANAAALGEKWIGAGKDVDDLVLITLGTGVGGGIVVGGRALHGFVGMAAEIGHITIEPDGAACGCGNSGCLEMISSATSIARAASEAGLGDGITSRGVFELAESGDARAVAVFERAGWALGVALASLGNIFNFPMYLISGGPLPAWKYFAPTMLAEARRRSFTLRNTASRIEPAALGNEAGLYGSALLPFHSGV